MFDFDRLLEFKEYEDDVFQYLIFLLDSDGTEIVHDFLIHSEMYYAFDITNQLNGARILKIVPDPDIYKKYYVRLDEIREVIKKKLFDVKRTVISSIRIEPNLKKFRILDNKYVPVLTPWEEINKAQDIMFEQFRKASDPIAFQNIGNTCRIIMQKVSNNVFDPQLHTDTGGKGVSEGEFKNRLHTYIKTELGGHDNERMRAFSLSIIDSAEKAVNIANGLTHSLNADSFIAESCVVSTISLINIIRIIERNKNAL
jgi:hypothetical protein